MTGQQPAGRRSRKPLCRLILLVGVAAASASAGRGKDSGSRTLGTDSSVTVPDRAMLQTMELHGATRTTVGDDSWAWLRPPEPCADGAYPSAGMRLGSRTISAVVRSPGPQALTLEYVAVYLPNGARRYVRDLHRAMDRGRGMDAQGSWDILDAGVAGRDSLLLRLRHNITHADRTVTRNTYIAVARVGRVLVVIADVGGEAGDGRREIVEQLINPALRRTHFLL